MIFVHGCFWHGHTNCKYYVVPKTRTDWWLNKINTNIANDEKAIKALKKDGWKINNVSFVSICVVTTVVDNNFFEITMPWVKIVVTKLPHAMIINELKVIKLFCELDDFAGAFDKKMSEHLIGGHCPQSFHRSEIGISLTSKNIYGWVNMQEWWVNMVRNLYNSFYSSSGTESNNWSAACMGDS